MSELRICRECGFPITDDPRIAREQAVCCCIWSKEGLVALLTPHNSSKLLERTRYENGNIY
jgi:hypothetical protein